MLAPVVHILIDEQGVARTINRRVKVKMIVQKHLIAGDSVSEIAEHYEIDPADVYAALTYYYDNKSDMDADFARQREEIAPHLIASEQLRAKIEQRMAGRTDEI